ncbi:MAG: hypothetical protein WCF67_21740 [Chitinophagaceae bacterium]
MLTSAAFILILILCLLFIRRTTKNKTLSRPEILLGFIFKVAMGCLYGYIFQKYYGGDDTWMLHNGSLQEYDKLMHNPLQFFADLDPTASFRRNNSFTEGWYFLLSDLEYWIITKPLAVFNMVSRGNYYINVIFFNLLTFWGQYLLYKLFAARFPNRSRLAVLIIFFLPSAAFWLSGIRPDGWIMVAMGITLYYFHAWLSSGNIKHALLVLIGLAGLIIFRSPFLLILGSGLIAWYISEKRSLSAGKVFAVVYGVAVVFFFATSLISPSVNMLTYVVHRQQEFFQLQGNTVYKLNALRPDVSSFLQTFHQALINTLFRPLPWEAKGILQWVAAIETMFTWFMLVASLLIARRIGANTNPVIWLCLLFGIFLYLFIGYTVPFPGAIARYKVIPELLLILAAGASTRFPERHKQMLENDNI